MFLFTYYYRKSSPLAKKERVKESRVWDHSGTSKDMQALDFSESKDEGSKSEVKKDVSICLFCCQSLLILWYFFDSKISHRQGVIGMV